MFRVALSTILIVSIVIGHSTAMIEGFDVDKMNHLRQKYGKVYASIQKDRMRHMQAKDATPPPADPYDHSVTYYSGSQEDGTGRFEISLLAVDPEAVRAAKSENGASDSMFTKFWRGLTKVAAKFFVVIISAFALIGYCYLFFLLVYKRGIYDEFWQGMANQYQELPEDRLHKKHLQKKYLDFWNNFSFRCPRVGTINGIWLNTMFKIKKYEGQMDPQNYIFDSHMYEIEGRYKMKRRPILDYDAIKKIQKRVSNTLVLEPFFSLHYPDKIDDASDPRVRAMINGDTSGARALGTFLSDLKEEEAKVIKDFIRREIAIRNAIYYPFFINLPLKKDPKETIQVEGRREDYVEDTIHRHWFYYEVEIVSRLGTDTSLVIGLLPAPNSKIEDVNNKSIYVYPEEEDAKPGPGMQADDENPDWVKENLYNFKKSEMRVSPDKQYLEGWKQIVPGELQNSIGFDISNGKVKVSGGLSFAIDMDTWMQQIHDPKSIWKATEPRKNLAEREKENAQKRLIEEDDEGKTYVGDCFGLAYNAHSGYVFLTYNGMVINKTPDEINTKINMAILEKFDEDEVKFDLEKAVKEQKKMYEDPKYFKGLKLDATVKREIDIRNLIKIDTAPSYIPCIYTDQNTRFRINMGATAFRSTQPEFQAGLLQQYPGPDNKMEVLLERMKTDFDRLDFEEEPAY